MIEAKRVSASRVVCVFLACLFSAWLCADGLPAEPNASEPESDVVIELTRFEITPETLELAYDIRNDSNDDVWVGADIDTAKEPNFATCLGDAGQTIILRRRADVPSCLSYGGGLSSHFVRLRSRGARAEAQSIRLPLFNPNQIDPGPLDREAAVARQLAVEIGYYPPAAVARPGGRGGFDPYQEEEFYRDLFALPPALPESARVLSIAIEGVRIPFEMGDAESYPVYSDLLAHWFAQAPLVVVQAKTNCFHTCSAGDYLRSHLEDLREDTIRDYNRKNGVSIALGQQFAGSANVVLVTDDELAEMRQELDWWTVFYERYPGSPGLSELSCVGFSDDHIQALAYVGTTSGDRAGSGTVFLLEWNGLA